MHPSSTGTEVPALRTLLNPPLYRPLCLAVICNLHQTFIIAIQQSVSLSSVSGSSKL